METFKNRTFRDYAFFIVGLFISGVGVAITKRGELGVSPVSSIANVMSIYIPVLTLGNWIIVSNCVLILGQVIILGKRFKLYQFLQIPLSFLFGYFTDFGTWIMSHFDNSFYPFRLCCVVVGTAALAFGISMTVTINIIMNSGEAFVKAIVDRWNLEFGTVKVVFDVSCVTIAVILSLIFFKGQVVGTREGTVIAAFLTGIFVKIFMKLWKTNKN